MDVFVRNLPDQMTEKQVNNYFRPYFERLGIKTWKIDKLKARGCAVVTILDVPRAQQFLYIHGQTQPGPQGFRSVRSKLFHMNRPINCIISNTQPDKFLISSLEKEEKDKHTNASVLRRKGPQPRAEEHRRVYDLVQMFCGQWDYLGSELSYVNYYQSDRMGQIAFGRYGLFVTLSSSGPRQENAAEFQLEIPYRTIQSYTTGSWNDPSLTFSLAEPPKIFEKINQDAVAITGDSIVDGLNRLLLDEKKPSPIKRKRISSLDTAHETVVASCLTYRFQLRNPGDIRAVQSLKRFSEIPGSISWSASLIMRPSFAAQMTALNSTLASCLKVPFDMKFQMQKLAQNGSLPPYRVTELLIAINKQITDQNSKAFVDAVYQLYAQVPYPGPNADASDFSLKSLTDLVTRNRVRIDKGESYSEKVEDYEHIISVHKATVTPTGVYLDGPYPEVKNRVLRKYSAFPNHFLSVCFSDEDGEFLRHDRQTSNEDVFRKRFKDVLGGVRTSSISFAKSPSNAQIPVC